MLPKVNESKAPPVLDARDREHHSRLSALSNFSIGDMFRDVRDGSKSVKFPEKLLKVLEQKLQDIAMGKDAAFVFHLICLIPAILLLFVMQIFRPARAPNNGQVLWTVHDRQLQTADEGESQD